MATLRSAVAKASESWKIKLSQRPPLTKVIQDFNFKTGYYNQIGLRWHDIMPRNSVVTEAFRRLPREEREAIDFRLARAHLLSANKTILPKEEWTKEEDDAPYLEPYIKLVERELRDKADWDNLVSPRTYP